jgi:hypothetical protein
MLSRHTARALSLLFTLAVATGASAQTPAALPRINVAPAVGNFQLNNAALDGQGNVTLLWQLSPPFLHTRSQGRRFSALDVPLGPVFQLNRTERLARVASNERGDTVMTWMDIPISGPHRIMVRRIRPGLPPLTLMANRTPFFLGVGDVDIDREGRFVVVWTETDRDSGRGLIRGQRFNADGSRQGPIFGIDSTAGVPRIAMNHRTGEFVVVFLRPNPGQNPGIFGQRFGFTTGRQGSEFEVNSEDVGQDPQPDVGRADDGSFVVAWTHRDFPDPLGDVFAQLFDAEGERRSELVIAKVTIRWARLAVAPEGHFVLAWEIPEERIRISLQHRDGTPAAPAQLLTSSGFSPEPDFGFNGTFVLGWADFFSSTVNYQRFAASPGTEACLFRNGHFRCDTARTGGSAEIDHVFAVRRDTPLLGDVDGDGRDDYCLFRGSRFECDSGHDYGAPEVSIFFGQAGDTPLLGDVNGDGRDDACVFRAGHFLCDFVRNNDAAELDIAFGQAGDLALVGDLDGDGRAEPCVYRVGMFLCDTARNGGTAETVIAFGGPGETPLLGDFNFDGRDDPCVYGGGVFRCDTAHDGGAAEAQLAFSTAPGAKPLIGNVDGI